MFDLCGVGFRQAFSTPNLLKELKLKLPKPEWQRCRYTWKFQVGSLCCEGLQDPYAFGRVDNNISKDFKKLLKAGEEHAYLELLKKIAVFLCIPLIASM